MCHNYFPDRFGRATGDPPRSPDDCAVRIQRGDIQNGAVPWHVGMIPRKPSEAPAIGRQPWRGEEVVSAGDDVAWCGAWLRQVDRDDGIDNLTCIGVILAHADPAMAAMVDDAVCKSPVAITREWRWRKRRRLTLTRAQPVQPAIHEIRKIEDAKRDCPRPATIFVHAGAHVGRLWHDVSRTCAGPTRAHYDVATLLLRPCPASKRIAHRSALPTNRWIA